MSVVLEAIYTRRSIRRYAPDPVPEDAIREIIRAGMNAPSAGNEQPWQFVIIDRREILDGIPTVHPHAAMIREAPVAILVCGDLTLETKQGYWVQDCAAATQNMLLAAAALGLGSVWLGVYPRDDRVTGLRRLLGIPETVVPFALLPVGHPAEHKPRKDEFHPERIHRHAW